MMRLSDLEHLGIRILRDGEFSNLGLLNHDSPRLLVCYYDANYEKALLSNPCVSAVVTSNTLVDSIPDHLGVIVSDNPSDIFYLVHEHLRTDTDFYGGTWESEIDPSCSIDSGAFIAPFNVRIGPGTTIHRGAQIHSNSTIKANVSIGPNTVIGFEGYEPKNVFGRAQIIRHGGGVMIEENVDILANSNVAKSVFRTDTRIGYGTKIDALVNISHNVSIGQNCKIAANVSIAGSSVLLDNVWVGPGAVLSSGITVGEKSYIVLGSVVTSSVKDHCRVAGNPARIIGTVS